MQINITKELGAALKQVRKENKVTSRELSALIKKSPTYISKLENADIKRLEIEEIMLIFEHIFKGKGDFKSKFEEFIGKCTFNLSEEDIKRQIWLLNFDTAISKIPIPPELVDYCLKTMETLNISIPEIVARINLNEDLEKNDVDYSKYEKNFWHDAGDYQFIIMDVTIDEYELILSKRTTICTHVKMFALVYNIMKYSAPTFDEANSNAVEILRKFKFYSVRERNKALRDIHSEEEREEILTDFDKINSKIVEGLNYYFKSLSAYNIKYANEKLYVLLKNFETERALAIAFLGIDLQDLKPLSVETKKAFLEDVKKLVDEYSAKKEDIDEITLL